MTRIIFINEINVAGAYRYDTYAGTTVEPWECGEIVTFGLRGKFKVLITSCEKVILVPHGPRPWYIRLYRWLKKRLKPKPKPKVIVEPVVPTRQHKGCLILVGLDFPHDSWVRRGMLKYYEPLAEAQGINFDNYERFYHL
jgi:hypothetical protein